MRDGFGVISSANVSRRRGTSPSRDKDRVIAPSGDWRQFSRKRGCHCRAEGIGGELPSPLPPPPPPPLSGTRREARGRHPRAGGGGTQV